ncbi:hypothetical protein [Taklimakanibacter deserti]|uniref:hypothetical protein n=1 Tax=Taklimakanibacter deserti TaxID=2267839 RepID=UPI000E659D6F
MNRRDQIKLALERIKVTKSLVANQVEFMSLAKAIGYEPVHAPATVQRLRAQLSDARRSLVRLTRSGQNKFTRPARATPFVEDKAAA